MPTRKIADPPPPPCRSRDHNPPNMRVFPPGTYEHVCSACGHKVIFVVSPIYCTTRPAPKRPVWGLRTTDEPTWSPRGAETADGVSFRW